ncbi:MAG: Holliday junction branch migration protein RuvA [Candidatus Marinimicrobia bacterium]|nr:Holliday junction branch migration protein RuvA [Candidatus Neomarinimicrobiota bacterium]
MIDSIHGILVKKQPTFAILDVHGVRFRTHISLPTYEYLPASETPVTILTYLHVREDILDLYGFHSENQRDLFIMLIGISGIGPRLAMTILAGTSPTDFKTRIIAGDVKSLTVIPGIGPKTAKRMILELKDKFVKLDDDESLSALFGDHTESDTIGDAINAMVSLGYSRSQAHQALKKMEKSGGVPDSIEDILKKALSIIL